MPQWNSKCFGLRFLASSCGLPFSAQPTTHKCSAGAFLLASTKGHHLNKIGQGSFIYKSWWDCRIKCGWRNLIKISTRVWFCLKNMRFSLTAFTLDNHTWLQSSVLKKRSTCSHELSLILNRYISLRRLDNTSILQRVKKNDFAIKRCCGVDPGSSIIQFNDISSGHTILFHFRYV